MEIRLNRFNLRIDWLMLLFPCIAAALGEGRRTMMLMLSLFAHESAHLLAARAMHVRINHLRLTPFGAMARIDNPYSISAMRLFAVSAAGPVANLLVLLITAALCHWRLLDSLDGAELLQINLMLMLFNLLPALPLDGGRMLYAILTKIMPRHRAAELGILFGRILAAALLLMPVIAFAAHSHLNLSPIFAALFLLTSAQDERRALTDSRVRTLMDCMRPLDEPLPVSMVAISAQTPAEIALKAALPDRATLFAVYDQGRFSRFIDDRTILNRMINDTKEKNVDSFKKTIDICPELRYNNIRSSDEQEHRGMV